MLADGTIDGRVSADDNDVRATGYNRPEDIVLQTLADGTQLLYFATTDSDVNATGGDGTSRVYALNLATTEVKLFASPQSIDLATGMPASAVSETPTILPSTPKGTSTSSKTAAAALTTISGSPPTGTRTAICWMREKDWPAGRPTEPSGQSSPVSTSTGAIRIGRS